MSPTLVMFLLFVAILLVVTAWASARTSAKRGYASPHHAVGGVQNGWAIAGDYMSAAAFLGITGLVAFFGFDGFIYSVGWLVAYLTVLFLIAEPLRNTGRFTMGDVISFRLRGRSVRAVAAISTLAISLFYMIAQMVGAGSLVHLLLPQLGYTLAIVGVGALMLAYVVFGGMVTTTWVQIIKAGLLLAAALALSVMVMAHYGFSFSAFFGAAANVAHSGRAATNLLAPGLRFHGKLGGLDLVSLGLALVLGTAGLPHILMRFYTVPSAKAARSSVAWAMILIGIFYLSTTFMGFGAATIVGQGHIGAHMTEAQSISYIERHPRRRAQLVAAYKRDGYLVTAPNSNMAAPLLANQLGGSYFMAFVAAVAFATILAVVAGLTIAASSAFAHDIWWNLVRGGSGDEQEQIRVARGTAFILGILAIVLAICLRTLNVAFLIGLAFAIAASANVPTIILSLAWRRFNHAGAISGMIAGLASSLLLIAVGPVIMGVDPPGVVHHLIQAPPLFPLENPGLVSIPIGFLAAILGTLFSRDPDAEADYNQVLVRANTGIGAEV